MTNKEFKDIEGYEGLYSISKDAKIKNRKGKITNGWEHSLKGYRKVRLYKNNKSKDYFLHRLVAIAYIPKVEGKNLINHKDCNPRNNCAKNLEWCTPRENIIHALNNNRMVHPTKEVINIVTKEVFTSVKLASESIGMKPNTLTCKLIGKRKNNTKLRFNLK